MSINKKFTVKEKLFAHLETWRLYTVIWCGLVSFAGSCLVFNGFPPLRISLLAFIVPMMGWTAGLYLSDFLDRELDSIQKPHRPIPSGRIKPIEALVIGAVFAITGFGLSFLLGFKNIILVFVVAGLVFSYAKLSKSQGFFGNFNRGVVTVAAYFYGVFSINPEINSIPIYIWLLSFVFLLHDMNSNLIGAIRDMSGDKKGGYITFPVKYGLKKSIIVSFILSATWLSILFSLTLYYNFLRLEFFLMMAIDLFILILLYVYLIISLKTYNRKKALRFHEFFVIERIVLASALLFGIVKIQTAFIVFIFALIITIISQFFLRRRYEFKELA